MLSCGDCAVWVGCRGRGEVGLQGQESVRVVNSLQEGERKSLGKMVREPYCQENI